MTVRLCFAVALHVNIFMKRMMANSSVLSTMYPTCQAKSAIIRYCSNWVSKLSAASAAEVGPLFWSFWLILLVSVMLSRHLRTYEIQYARLQIGESEVVPPEFRSSLPGLSFRCKRQCVCFHHSISESYWASCEELVTVRLCFAVALHSSGVSHVSTRLLDMARDKEFGRPGTGAFTRGRATPRMQER